MIVQGRPIYTGRAAARAALAFLPVVLLWLVGVILSYAWQALRWLCDRCAWGSDALVRWAGEPNARTRPRIMPDP